MNQRKLLLFRKNTIRIAPKMKGMSLEEFARRMQSGIPVITDDDDDDDSEPITKVIYEFIGMVDDVKDVAKIVRTSPLDKYVLFEGSMHNVTVPMQVLIDGRPADTMREEWDVDPESVEIPDDIKNLEINESDADLELPPYQPPQPPHTPI